MTEKTAKADLNTTITVKRDNGMTITIATVCDTWADAEKFIKDSEDNLLKGNNGNQKNQH